MAEAPEPTVSIAPEENSEVTSLKEQLKQAETKLGEQGTELKDAKELNEKATRCFVREQEYLHPP